MINNWLNYENKSPKPTFTVVEVSEKKRINNIIKTQLQREILDSYRDINYLKYRYKRKARKELVNYLEHEVLPSMKDQLSINVWQGDFGEIIAYLIVSHFQELSVPLKKIRWKLNKEKSIFATDMIAHNSDGKITDMYYYEIKTRQNLKKKEKSKYITVLACKSLEKDEKIPNEAIADFLSRQFYDKNDFESADKYGDIVDKANKLNRNFELFFVGEKSTYSENILAELNALPPKLKPLNITIVLIENFKELIKDLRETITKEATNIVHNE